jgi:type II secretory pathway component PulC
MSRRLLVLACPLLLACGPTQGPSTAPSDDADGDIMPASMQAEWSDPPTSQTAAPTDRSRPPRTVFRSEIDRATGRGPAYFLRQLAPEPFRHHGVFVGWEVTALFPDDPGLCGMECGIALGDVILSVNGSRLETPQQLSDAFTDLPDQTRLVVHSLREGKRREVTYTIVDDR